MREDIRVTGILAELGLRKMRNSEATKRRVNKTLRFGGKK